MSDDTRRGVYAAIGASVMMAAMGSAIKAVAGEINNETVVFLRNAFGLVLLTPGLWRHDGLNALATHRLTAHLARALFGLAAMYCFFYAIAHMNLAEAVLLNFSSPIFTALIASLWLRESFTPRIAAALVLGLAGVALILKPQPGAMNSAAWVGAFSAVLAALAMVNIRRLSDTEPIYRIVFYFALIGTVVSAVPLSWAWETLSKRALALMAAAGVFATIGQLLLTYSYSRMPAARAGTLNYSTVVFAALAGWAFWGETLDWLSVIGAVLICYAGVLVTRRPPLAAEAD